MLPPACRFFGALHLEPCKLLASICLELGQRALVGLTCMDRNCPEIYTKSTEQNLADTEAFIQHVRGLGSDLVQPVVTPRFVPTCTPALLAGLGKVAWDQAVLVQSHISESHDEVVSISCMMGCDVIAVCYTHQVAIMRNADPPGPTMLHQGGFAGQSLKRSVEEGCMPGQAVCQLGLLECSCCRHSCKSPCCGMLSDQAAQMQQLHRMRSLQSCLAGQHDQGRLWLVQVGLSEILLM